VTSPQGDKAMTATAKGSRMIRGTALAVSVLATTLLAAPAPLAADELIILVVDKPFEAAWQDLESAVKANKMGVVTRASASRGAKGRGLDIPGNAVVGVYRNDYAVRMLEASIPAGIEAPLRFYLTERDDGSTGLSYKRPSAVFAPYGSADLDAMAADLDAVFQKIAKDAGAR